MAFSGSTKYVVLARTVPLEFTLPAGDGVIASFGAHADAQAPAIAVKPGPRVVVGKSVPWAYQLSGPWSGVRWLRVINATVAGPEEARAVEPAPVSAAFAPRGGSPWRSRRDRRRPRRWFHRRGRN